MSHPTRPSTTRLPTSSLLELTRTPSLHSLAISTTLHACGSTKVETVLQRDHQRVRQLPLKCEHTQKLSLEDCCISKQPRQHIFLVELGRHLHQIHSI
jgi:hypothetical protein